MKKSKLKKCEICDQPMTVAEVVAVATELNVIYQISGCPECAQKPPREIYEQVKGLLPRFGFGPDATVAVPLGPKIALCDVSDAVGISIKPQFRKRRVQTFFSLPEA